MEDRSAKLRAFYARMVTGGGGVTDPRIAEAFATVPREPFAGPAPWLIPTDRGYVATPDDDPAFLYQDALIALDPARAIHIGQPSLHARLLGSLALQPGETVLQVGAGSGYYTAIMAHLVGPKGRVIAFEIDPDLAARAAQNLADLPWVSIEARSGLAGDLPPADAIYVNAGVTQPSWTWLDVLRPGGRLLLPLQPSDRFGAMLRIERPALGGAAWPARFVARVRFVSAAAPHDPDLARRLKAGFDSGRWRTVQSLRLDDAPDATSWVAGDGWWLSMAP